MSESINAEFETYVKAELGDIAVVSEGRFISPKIQNYFKVWNHQQTKITELEAQLAAAWIPVNQRLPVEGESVFVFSKYGQSDLADFIGGAFENCWLIDDADETITHWIGKPPYPPIDKANAGGSDMTDKELLELAAKVDIEKSGKTILTIQDIANLSPDEFSRFLPDLKTWHEAAYNVQGLFTKDTVKTSMIWFDDGEAGTLRYVDFLKKDGSTLFRLQHDA